MRRVERVCRDCGTTCLPWESRRLGWSIRPGGQDGWGMYQGRMHLAKDIVLCPVHKPAPVLEEAGC